MRCDGAAYDLAGFTGLDVALGMDAIRVRNPVDLVAQRALGVSGNFVVMLLPGGSPPRKEAPVRRRMNHMQIRSVLARKLSGPGHGEPSGKREIRPHQKPAQRFHLTSQIHADFDLAFVCQADAQDDLPSLDLPEREAMQSVVRYMENGFLQLRLVDIDSRKIRRLLEAKLHSMVLRFSLNRARQLLNQRHEVGLPILVISSFRNTRYRKKAAALPHARAGQMLRALDASSLIRRNVGFHDRGIVPPGHRSAYKQFPVPTCTSCH
jgi:hypothetical protein